MKKAFAILLAAVMMLGCFTACGPSEDPKKDPMDSTPDVSTTSGQSTSTTADSDDNDGTTTTEGQPTVGTQDAGTTGTTQMTPSTTKKTTASVTKQTTQKTTGATKPAEEEDTELAKAIKAYLTADPNVKKIADHAPASKWGSNIQAITYDGATKGGKKTKVFAYIGFPEGASKTSKVPAVVLVHGGGGHAFAEWVKVWTDKGYAAIAMDTTGQFPSESSKGKAGGEGDNSTYWQYGLYGVFKEDGYVNAPNNDEMQSSLKAVDQQWMYHAVIDTIVANNILRADERVDANKIGITGISWGGIISSIAIGYDTRYAYAIPVYGSGYLDEAHSYMGNKFSNPATKKLWSAADRFEKIDFPVFWMGYTNDVPFSINSNSKSYLDTKDAGAKLCMKMLWGHSHGQGWAPKEIYRFADSMVKGGNGLVTCLTEPMGRNFSFLIDIPKDVVSVSARAYYITEPLSYTSKNGNHPSIDQTFKSVTCTVDGNQISGTLPASAHSYYVEITAKTSSGNYITSTQFVEGI